MMNKTKLLAAILSAILILSVRAAAGPVEEILKQADTWIISDTARIMAYIDSCNKLTDVNLEKSPNWNDAYRDLSFLLGIDNLGSPQIDNTGRIYFTMRITGQIDHLFYVDSPGSFPHQLTPNNWAEEGYNIFYYLVHPSGDYVLVGVMKHGSEKYNIWLFNRDGTFRPLLVNPDIEYSDVTFKNKDEFFVIVATDTSRVLSRYTISTGKLEPLYSEKEWVSIYDYRDGQILCQRWFSFSESQIFILDEKTTKPKNLTPRGYFEGSTFSGDGRIISLSNALSKTDEFNKLIFVDPSKAKRLSLFYDPKTEIDSFQIIPQVRACYISLNQDGFSKIVAIDYDGASLAAPAIGIGVVSSLSSNDFGEIVFESNSPNLPNTIFYTRLNTKAIQTVATVATFGFDFSKVNVEIVRYPSKDGTLIPALLYIPADVKKDGSNPAIVVYHGGPPDQSRPYFQRNIAYALAKGFVLLFPNVRGSTGYGSAWEQADNLEGRYKSLEDDVAALDYLAQSGYSRPDKIGIWGGSYGGYTVNYLGVTAGDKFNCAVSEVGVADVDYLHSHGDQTFRQGWEQEFATVGSKLSHDLSPIFKAENLKCPILVTAGFNDPRVFAGDPRRFGYVLSRLGKDVLYHEDLTSGHWGTTKQEVIDAYARAYVFFIDHIMSKETK
jgi:dipeptidyl aminopeptidase/acylaminoacyl peptidase